MIALKELNKKGYPVDGIVESNLQCLLSRLNMVRAAWQKPMTVTSGLRSPEQQQSLIKAGKSTAAKSKHLVGAAADILDADGSLKSWLRENPSILENACLWCEHWDSTPGWCHFQIVPPASGARWFVP